MTVSPLLAYVGSPSCGHPPCAVTVRPVLLRMAGTGGIAAKQPMLGRGALDADDVGLHVTYLVRTPAVLAKAPRLAEMEIEPYTVAEVRRILSAAGEV